MEARLPMVTRWTVCALGAPVGPRAHRAQDPVAAWLIRHHPGLLPAASVSSMLAMLRARAQIIDRMIVDEADRVGALGRPLDYWSFGAGLDARWHRLRVGADALTAGRYSEIEDPGILSFKSKALEHSRYSEEWRRVESMPLAQEMWTVPDTTAPNTLVSLEGVAARLGVEGLRRLLGRIRKDAPSARVIVDLPGILHHDAGTTYVMSRVGPVWGAPGATSAAALGRTALRRLGWAVTEDVWLAARPELRAASGMTQCAGMDALRVMALVPID